MRIKYIGNCQASVEVIQRLRATEEVKHVNCWWKGATRHDTGKG
ncbi:hypothetical protein [Paenibacillus sp. FSL H7-0737]|nr:hypothetical protein [Paenibacillus sp. FSL H7-0737]